MTAAERLVGPYRLLEPLGEGGMGEVWRAVDTMLEREVALKTLRPEMSAREDLVERFRVEAIALAKLHHRHIAAVYAFFREGERHHIAMQYVRGHTLETALRDRGRLPWREAAAVAIDVLLALEHAHALGVVHRDLKPANLMIDDEQRTVVMDFGIARVLAKQRQTRAGTLVGTLEYIAPEIVQGQDADARSDLYALGCVLFEMVTGELPFRGSSDFELMRAHAEQSPPRPAARAAELPAALEAIILRALAKKPGDRFANAAAFRLALQAAAGTPVAAPETAWAQPATRPPVSPAPKRMSHKLGRLGVWLDLPSGGGWRVWAPWLRANPGLAGVAAVGVGGLCMSLVVAAHSACCRAPLVQRATPPSVVEAPPVSITADRPGRLPVPIASTQVEASPTPAPPTPTTAPRPDPSVFVMPPPPKPRISVERPAPAPQVEPVPAPRAAPPHEPKPEPRSPSGPGWYVKH